MHCPLWKPHRCITGECVDSPRECQFLYLLDGEEEQIKMNATVCEANEYKCYDGSCRTNPDDCPIFQGCASTSKPIICEDGSCVSKESDCVHQRGSLKDSCANGEQLCYDGLCRTTCPKHNGCPASTPLMCSNGHCVNSIAECVGDSSCLSTENSFRCPDGSCTNDMKKCPSTFREFGNTDVEISVFPKKEANLPIVIGDNKRIIANINIPSDIFSIGEEITNHKIKVRSVPRQEIQDTFCLYDETRVDDVMSVLPYSDLDYNYTLTYEYAVLSTVVSISMVNDTKVTWNNDLLITLLYDFPKENEAIATAKEIIAKEANMTSMMPLDFLQDVCLGKLDLEKREWSCNNNTFKTKNLENFQLTGRIDSPGVYAVIISTRKNMSPLIFEENFLVKNRIALIVVVFVVVGLFGVGGYIFYRIYRYRVKYKRTKELVKKTEEFVDDLSKRSTNVQGQTIEDIEQGIVFTDNPAFKTVYRPEDNSRKMQLEMIHGKYMKRLKALERNQAMLSQNLESVNKEISRIKDFKKEISKDDMVKKEIRLMRGDDQENIYGSINPI